ncbi:MAG: DUF3793 family protein [Ruminococcaceae bacterium]|nr:DUF3793 family protein [Oscillospiraceae bacterium]
MSDSMIVRFCAPTLAGVKTAGLFSCRYDSEKELNYDLRRLNRLLNGKGIFALPLRKVDGHALIYVFRPSLLKSDLGSEKTRELLIDCGYRPDNMSSCLKELIGRLGKEGFPHEIGAFLGYPIEDVIGFIRHKGKNCKCVGMWKVYGDKNKCEKLFEKYRVCTSCYLDALKNGNTIERLAVVA